jgi:hypothetical protein
MNPERNTRPRVTRCETAPAAARNLGWPVCNPIEFCWLLLLYIPNFSFLWTQINLPLNNTLLQHSFKSIFNGVTLCHLSWHKLVELLYCFSLSNSLSLLLSTTHRCTQTSITKSLFLSLSCADHHRTLSNSEVIKNSSVIFQDPDEKQSSSKLGNWYVSKAAAVTRQTNDDLCMCVCVQHRWRRPVQMLLFCLLIIFCCSNVG